MAEDLTDMKIRLAGSWSRPSKLDVDEHVSFFPTGQLEFKVTPSSARAAMINVALGESRHGTWALRARRPQQLLDRMRGSVEGSVKSLPASSVNYMPKALRNFANYDPETGTYRDPARPQATAHPPQIAWLILKITKFTDSRLNFNVGGLRVDVMDWLNDAAQVFGDNHHAVLAFDSKTLTLRLNNGKVETWRRISRFLPDPSHG